MSTRRLSPSEQLVADVVAADGVLKLREGPWPEAHRLLGLIRTVNRFGKAPEGKRLVHEYVDDESEPHVRWHQISIEPGPEGTRAAHGPVAVPSGPLELHHLLNGLDDPAGSLGLSPDAAARGLRVVHVLLAEVQGAGCDVDWADGPGGRIRVQRDQMAVSFRLTEEVEERELLPDLDSGSGGKQYSWQRVQAEVREVKSGRLRLELDADWDFRDRRGWWADRKRWRLEDKLGEVLTEIDYRLCELAERSRAAERAAEERLRAWEAAMESARQSFADDRRIQALENQLAGWQKAAQIRAYCEDLDELDDEHNDQCRAWVAWARRYAEQIDPRGKTDWAPQEVEPKPEDLRPYLGGWSPFGPPDR